MAVAGTGLQAVNVSAAFGSVPTGSSGDPSASSPVPPMPAPLTPDQVAGANNLAAIGSLQSTLLAKYSDTYGGMYNNGDDTFTVLTVGDGSQLIDFVNQDLATMSTPDVPAPTVTYHSVEVPLQRLKDISSQVASDLKSTAPESGGADRFPITGVGVDQKNNNVTVTTSTPSPGLLSYLTTTYGFNNFAVEDLPGQWQAADRASDSPPWNSGDQIQTPANSLGNYKICSSGFGVQNAYGHGLLSAGHCGHFDFYNSGYVGTTGAGAGDPDSQLIYTPGGSSNIFWKQTATREYVAATTAPIAGNSVCLEGYKTQESCGSIVITDYTAPGILGHDINGVPFSYDSHDQFITNNSSVAQGDSGGPVIWPTEYGYIAQGTITAGVIPPSGIEQGPSINTEITTEEFIYGVTVNTYSAP